MARPLLIDGKLPMHIFKIHGYRYAVTRTSVRKADGSYNYPQRIWGTVDDALNFTPNKRFLALSEQERAGILIPPRWHVVTGDGITVSRGRPSYEGESTSLLYGHTWFLEMLAEQCGLRDDLEHVLESRERADQILSLAYFSLLGGGAFSHLESAQRICWFPSADVLPPHKINRVIQSITEDDRQTLLRCRRARTRGTSWLGVASTSFTYFGRSLAEAKRGRINEHDPADQINVLVVYDLEDGQPVYYRRMPGNIPDMRTLRVMLNELKDNGFNNLCLVFDRGYVSGEVLAMLLKSHCRFVMMPRGADSQMRAAIRSLKAGEMTRHANWLDKHSVYGRTFDYRFEVPVRDRGDAVDTMRLCLFFDPEWQGERDKRLNARVTEMERQLEGIKDDGQRLDEATAASFGEYFSLRLTRDGKLRSYAVDEDRLARETATSGYFACITNCMPPSRHTLSEILDIYGMRSEQEMAFTFVKSEQEGRRFCISSKASIEASTKASTDGRLFVQFVALVLNCRIYRTYIASERLQKLFPSRRHMLDELRSIRLLRHSRRAKIITEIVGRQVEIFKEFKMPVPLHLLPAAARKDYAEALKKP